MANGRRSRRRPALPNDRLRWPMLALLAAVGGQAGLAQQWKMQFFHDRNDSSLEIRDFQCSSPTSCMAAGVLIETSKKKADLKGTLVSTVDGGAHWSYEDIKEIPVSLFFLSASQGWMVTEKGVWQSAEGGRDWKKLKHLEGLLRVWFLDGSHGWAVGLRRAVYESHDGGRTWNKPAQMPRDPESSPTDLVYDWILFSGQHGLIAGSWGPMVPGFDGSQYAGANSVLLETFDGGAAWRFDPVEARGKLDRLRLIDKNTALGLVEYFGRATNPSELFRIDLTTRKSAAVFNHAASVARDFVIPREGGAVVAAVERLGESAQPPIPSKLEIWRSTSLKTWAQEKCDYRAVAMRAFLGYGDSHNVWAATDTGMILKREE